MGSPFGPAHCGSGILRKSEYYTCSLAGLGFFQGSCSTLSHPSLCMFFFEMFFFAFLELFAHGNNAIFCIFLASIKFYVVKLGFL